MDTARQDSEGSGGPASEFLSCIASELSCLSADRPAGQPRGGHAWVLCSPPLDSTLPFSGSRGAARHRAGPQPEAQGSALIWVRGGQSGPPDLEMLHRLCAQSPVRGRWSGEASGPPVPSALPLVVRGQVGGPP